MELASLFDLCTLELSDIDSAASFSTLGDYDQRTIIDVNHIRFGRQLLGNLSCDALPKCGLQDRIGSTGNLRELDFRLLKFDTVGYNFAIWINSSLQCPLISSYDHAESQESLFPFSRIVAFSLKTPKEYSVAFYHQMNEDGLGELL